jgi:Asp-tRNA(Asn)/Glu-tRNA(Gln) amidotransferase A subunit family amidase
MEEGVQSVYNLREVKAPNLRGLQLLLFAKLLRSPIGKFILRIIKKQNDFACVTRLAEGKLHSWMPLFYPIPEHRDEDQYNRHVELSKGFDLEEFMSAKSQVDENGEFRYTTIQDYIEKYQNQDLTPYQVAQAIFKAVEDSNAQSPPLNAVVVMKRDELFEEARKSADRYKNKKPLGPLDGVPVLIKDEVDVKGYKTTAGTTFMGEMDGVAAEDCPIVAKLRKAGALIIGKSNMHEFGIGTTGFNWHFGPARNPHNPSHYPGGSSSGSAAAVAAGLVPLAVGLDSGGSIRIPSALCGVVGLKPTFQRCDMDMPVSPTICHIGPIAATVKDAAIGYAIMAGPKEHAEASDRQKGMLPPPVHLASFSDDLTNVKIGIFVDFFNDADPEIVEACSKAVEHLESLGAQVVKISMPHMEEAKMAHAVTVTTELAAGAARHYEKSIKKFTPESQISFELGRSLDSCTYLAAQKIRRYAMSLLDDVFSKVDVMITPTTGCTAPELFKSVEKYGESNLVQTANLMRFIYHGNLCGIPGIAVPVGYSATNKNLPISLLVQARHWEEDIILRIARACEGNVSHKKPMIYYNILDLASKEPKEQ